MSPEEHAHRPVTGPTSRRKLIMIGVSTIVGLAIGATVATFVLTREDPGVTACKQMVEYADDEHRLTEPETADVVDMLRDSGNGRLNEVAAEWDTFQSADADTRAEVGGADPLMNGTTIWLSCGAQGIWIERPTTGPEN